MMPVVRIPDIPLAYQTLVTILPGAVAVAVVDTLESLACQKTSLRPERMRRLVPMMLIRPIKADEACIFSLGNTVGPMCFAFEPAAIEDEDLTAICTDQPLAFENMYADRHPGPANTQHDRHELVGQADLSALDPIVAH